MKKLVDTLGAVLIALGLCILPARADVLGGEVLATAAGVMVLLILGLVVMAISLLVDAIRKRRKNKEDDDK